MSIPKHRTYKRQTLTRLYSCNAHYNDRILISYNTVVVYESNKFIYVDYANQTITTKQHIRKFLKAIKYENHTLYKFLYFYLHNWRDSGYTKLLYYKGYDHLISINSAPDFDTL